MDYCDTVWESCGIVRKRQRQVLMEGRPRRRTARTALNSFLDLSSEESEESYEVRGTAFKRWRSERGGNTPSARNRGGQLDLASSSDQPQLAARLVGDVAMSSISEGSSTTDDCRRIGGLRARRKEKVKELIGRMTEPQKDDFICELLERQPGLILDILERRGGAGAGGEGAGGEGAGSGGEGAGGEGPGGEGAGGEGSGGEGAGGEGAGSGGEGAGGEGPGGEGAGAGGEGAGGCGAPEWCTCGRCQDMPTDAERLCCQGGPDSCISRLPDMDLNILDPGILRLARLYRNDVFGLEDLQEPGQDNKEYRHAAYRQYILWQHGRLGARNRLVIPSCCVWRIRRRFPDPHGQYTGFRPSL
ncbi:hypothetical protein Bbelb_433150 [Branchiostoma belcheri]|nr:hypothetical protein Bbelb_433150 [Branchiostoma belcheri]